MGFSHNARLDNIASGNGKMICGIPDVSKCPTLSGQWNLAYSNIAVHQSGDEVEKDLTYKRGQEVVSIDFYIIEDNFEKAESRLLGFLSGGSSPVVPGERGPSDIGDISIVMPRTNGKEILYLKDNVCVRIASFKSEIDIFAIARWIQSHFEMRPWSEVGRILPRPMRDSLGRGNIREGQALQIPMSEPLQGQVGKPIEIRVEMPSGTDPGRYLLKEDYDRTQFNTTWNNQFWTLTPMKVGLAKFKYIIVDKKTLLRYSYEVSIGVQP